MLGHNCHNADGHPVGLRHVGSHEINASLFQPEEEMSIATQSVELGSDQFRPDQPAKLECLFEGDGLDAVAER